MRSSSAWVRGVAALVTFMIALTFSAPPCDAADASKGAAPQTAEKRSLSAAADAHVAAMAPPPALAQDPGAGATSTSGSFFRSRKGVAAIVLMVAGAGYVAYRIPKDNEKVHSPIR